MTSHNHVWSSDRGFTMVELIVVLILMGILGAIGAARFFDRQTFDAAAFADQSRAMLRFAQKTAIAQNRPVVVRFDGESISLCFDEIFPCNPNRQVRTPAVSNRSTDSSCTSSTWACLRRPEGVTYTVSLGTVGGGTSRFLSFDALGRPFDDTNSGQTVGLTLDIVGDGPAQPTINVAPETGYVF